MRMKLDLYTADEFTAAAAFLTALAAAQRKDRIDTTFLWSTGDEPASRTITEPEPETEVTAGEIVDALHGALTAQPEADDIRGQTFSTEVDEPVKDFAEHEKAAEPAKRRPGRPRKETNSDVTAEVGAEIQAKADEVLQGEVLEPVSGQIDLEDVIAATNAVSQDNAPPAPEAPQPADPAAGWTEHDARNAGRALLARAPSPEVGNKKLAALLAPYGVQQVRALKPDQIEAFVVATQKEVF